VSPVMNELFRGTMDIEVPNFGFVNISEDYSIRYLQSTITFWKETASGVVVRTRFRGTLESFFNPTASAILEKIKECKTISIGKLVDFVTSKYNLECRIAVCKDVVCCLYDLWKLVIIEWVDNNPFQLIEVVENHEILHATHDNTREIIQNMKGCDVYSDPSVGLCYTRTTLISLILSNSIDIYCIRRRGLICATLAIAGDDYSEILFISGNGNDVSMIMHDLVALGLKKHFLLKMLRHGDSPILKSCDFKFCGTLKEELKDGDVDVYVH
jgi:hypothetical protein